jgi:hypothetical protein
MCSQTVSTNGVWVFLETDPNNPIGTCSLTTLTERGVSPSPPTSVSAGSGDGAIDLNWTVPPLSSTSPNFFQILCADDCGNPVSTSPPAPLYSTCINGVLSRRQINTGGSLPGGGTDGGTTTDGGTMSLVGGTLHTEATPPINCTPDGGANPIFVNDMGMSSAGPLANLDPRFVCSGQIGPTTNSYRISGLLNGSRYHFVVVSVDNYGNAAAAAVVDGTPQPTEDLYRRYRDTGGAAGSCFIATAAFGSYESGWVQVLRDFRDQALLPTAWGHRFVDWYYAHSPPAASWIAARGWARALVRAALLPVIGGAFVWIYFAAWQKALLVTLLLALVWRKRLLATLRRGSAT